MFKGKEQKITLPRKTVHRSVWKEVGQVGQVGPQQEAPELR